VNSEWQLVNVITPLLEITCQLKSQVLPATQQQWLSRLHPSRS